MRPVSENDETEPPMIPPIVYILAALIVIAMTLAITGEIMVARNAATRERLDREQRHRNVMRQFRAELAARND